MQSAPLFISEIKICNKSHTVRPKIYLFHISHTEEIIAFFHVKVCVVNEINNTKNQQRIHFFQGNNIFIAYLLSFTCGILGGSYLSMF